MFADRPMLARFLFEECEGSPAGQAALGTVLLNVAVACKAIARRVAYGALGVPAVADASPEPRRRLDLVANDLFLRCGEWTGALAGMASPAMDEPHVIPAFEPRGDLLLVYAPLLGGANGEGDVASGSVFAVLCGPALRDPSIEDYLQPGSKLVASGYAIYGSTTMFVVSVGAGVHGFTLDPQLGEFVLTHPSIRVPAATNELVVEASLLGSLTPGARRYADECLAGAEGPRGRLFEQRWTGSLVADLHRILMRGGVFLSPRGGRAAAERGRPSLLYEIGPISHLVEQAGGRASTGYGRALDIAPSHLRERGGFVFGSSEEVERIELYHRDHEQIEYDSPLFGERGLFRRPI